MLHIVLFSFMSFYQKVFSCEVFDETMFDTSICLISFFPTEVFLEIKLRHRLLIKSCR
jgi:hypothetical protein